MLALGVRFLQETPAPAPRWPFSRLRIRTIQPEKKRILIQQHPSLLKPKEGTAVKTAPQPHLDSALADGPEFAITDAAGYTATLETYRGRVLLFGVVSPDQKAAVTNLQQIYDAFGSNPGIRIFAVARHREDRVPWRLRFRCSSITDPSYWECRTGNSSLLDATGKIQTRRVSCRFSELWLGSRVNSGNSASGNRDNQWRLRLNLQANQIFVRFPAAYDFVLVPIHQNFRHTWSRVVI